MAESGNPPADVDVWKYPRPVNFNDDDPKKGYSTIFLSVPEMVINKPLFGKATAKNAEIKEKFNKDTVEVRITVTVIDKMVNYEYKKKLKEDIEPEKCSYQVKKGMVVLHLCKTSGESWAEPGMHRYLIEKDDST